MQNVAMSVREVLAGETTDVRGPQVDAWQGWMHPVLLARGEREAARRRHYYKQRQCLINILIS